jgi:hypothetical protein
VKSHNVGHDPISIISRDQPPHCVWITEQAGTAAADVSKAAERLHAQSQNLTQSASRLVSFVKAA